VSTVQVAIARVSTVQVAIARVSTVQAAIVQVSTVRAAIARVSTVRAAIAREAAVAREAVAQETADDRSRSFWHSRPVHSALLDTLHFLGCSPRGRQLMTLRDAVLYIARLPKAEHDALFD
jgi:hypothetical protein